LRSKKELKYFRRTKEEFTDTISATKKGEDAKSDGRKSQ
jgi:hypothetical protein